MLCIVVDLRALIVVTTRNVWKMCYGMFVLKQYVLQDQKKKK